MLRTIVEPADLSGAALGELKNWLGISRPGEDTLLIDLLGASLAMCEAFTSQTPLQQLVEERVPSKVGRYALTSRPVRSVETVEELRSSVDRTAIHENNYDVEFNAAGNAMFRLKQDTNANAVAVRFFAGIAEDWPSLPSPLRHGIIRLAAHYYRERDNERTNPPPVSVIALWRPWRVMRLT